MFIDIDIIAAWGGIQKKYNKGDLIFTEGDQCRCYYQIVEGSVKMFNVNLEGREFTQGIFYEGESFGEPPLFTNTTYPASAEAIQNSIVIRLPKEIFLKLLAENLDLQMKLILLLANRAYSKAMTAKIIMNSTPEIRILSFMDYYKSRHKLGAKKVLIPITRQQIANHTGLRVETTIRTLSRLKDKGRVEIINHKVYY
jgi:CRP-like cAMP-binding protein